MMAQKRLDELLKEDQEPFQLRSYIADRRTKLRASSQTQLQKPKPISGKFCRNACLFSFHGSPDFRKSPLFEFASPAAKSPCRSPIFLHIPARTAALLLEAALRIQKHSKTTHTPKNHGFGLFGSILKRLTNRGRKKEIESAKDILGWDSSVGRKSRISGQRDQKSGRYSCNVSTPSSAVWSETNEDKSQEDLETSSSGQSDHHSTQIFAGDFAYCQSPFRFDLHRSPSGNRTPEFLSPAASPCRTKTEEKDKYDVESLNKLEDGGEEEEKEQCSPVSVLDAPFEDDEEEDHDSFDIEGSYAIVQRSKQQLLKKLQRFEKLAGLDPIELDKRMIESDREEDDQDFTEPSFHEDWEIPKHMRLLVSDLIAEEEKMDGDEEMMKRVESWEDVEANTIDMMVEQDFTRDFGEWNRNQQQLKDTAAELELAIFGLLVQELWT